jgi:hypothetical protein
MCNLASIVSSFALLIPSVACCCECGPPPAVRESLHDASAVFFGRCISGRLRPAAHKVEFTFEVQRVWKGVTDQNRVTADGDAFPSSCYYNFEIGGTYIVYCSRVGGRLYVGRCSRTCAFPSIYSPNEAKELDAAVHSK